MLQLQNLLYLSERMPLPCVFQLPELSVMREFFPWCKIPPQLLLQSPSGHPASHIPQKCLPGATARRDTRGCEHLSALPTVKIDLSCLVWFGFQQMYSQITSFDGNDGERKENHPHDFLNVIQ